MLGTLKDLQQEREIRLIGVKIMHQHSIKNKAEVQ